MANRYWVGGTANWNSTSAFWSATDGGPGGAGVPNPADAVFFTALSGAVTVTWAAASPTVLSINCTGFTGTLATAGQNKTLAGTGLVWNSPVSCTITGAPTMTVSSTGSTAISVACSHASPSATNAPNFSFTGGTYALTIGGTGWRNIVFTGFAGSIGGGTNPTCYGSITLSSGGTFTSHGPTMAATGTFTSLGKTISGITVNAVGGTITLADAMTAGITSSTILTAGTLALAGFTLSTGIFSSSGSSTRAISFGTGNIALTSTTAAATVLSMATATGFTFTGTGGFTRNMAATATMQFGSTAGGSTTNAPNLTVNAGASALTITSGSYFKNVIFTGSTSPVTALPSLNMAGNLTLASGGLYISVAPTFLASGLVTSVGNTLGNLTINGSGITVTLVDALATTTLSTTTLTAGTLALAGFTLSTGIFSSSGSSTRAISFGSGNIALTSTTAADTVLSMATATGFTFTGTGGFTRNQAATATMVFGTTGGTTSNAPNLTVNAGASALTITSGSYFKDVIFTGSTCTVTSGDLNMAGNLTLASGGTYTSISSLTFRASATVTSNGKTLGTTTVNGTGITVTLADAMTVDIASTTTLTAGTLALAGFTLSTGTFSSSGSSTRAISFGSGNIALTSTTAAVFVITMGTATGFTWTGTGGFTRNQAATAQMEFGTTGGSTTNAPNLTVNAGASTLTIISGSYFKDVAFTGSTCTVTASGLNMAGNLTLASGGTYTAVLPTFLASATITSAGTSINSTTVNGSGITVTLADALTISSGNPLFLTQGTFTAANFNVTAGSFSSSNSNTRTLNMGSGTWTITGSSSLAWYTATTTGMTLNPSTSTITMTSASTKTFNGGGLTYYNLNQGGAGTLTISGSNTFNDITNTVQPNTVTFTAGTTQTVSNFSLSGTVGNLITINSATPGTQATLSKSSGTINAQYLSIKDSNATGGAVWNARESTNAGNNTGWNIFAGQANMFSMFP